MIEGLEKKVCRDWVTRKANKGSKADFDRRQDSLSKKTKTTRAQKDVDVRSTPAVRIPFSILPVHTKRPHHLGAVLVIIQPHALVAPEQTSRAGPGVEPGLS